MQEAAKLGAFIEFVGGIDGCPPTRRRGWTASPTRSARSDRSSAFSRPISGRGQSAAAGRLRRVPRWRCARRVQRTGPRSDVEAEPGEAAGDRQEVKRMVSRTVGVAVDRGADALDGCRTDTRSRGSVRSDRHLSLRSTPPRASQAADGRPRRWMRLRKESRLFVEVGLRGLRSRCRRRCDRGRPTMAATLAPRSAAHEFSRRADSST